MEEKATMTKEQCEQVMVRIMRIAMRIYHKYNPTGDHLSMFQIDDDVTIDDFHGLHVFDQAGK